MSKLTKQEQARLLAPYVGHKCAVHERITRRTIEGTLFYDYLGDMVGAKVVVGSIQIYAKPFSRITNEHAIRCAEIATQETGFETSARCDSAISAVKRKQQDFGIKFYLYDDFSSECYDYASRTYAINPAYLDYLRSEGYATQEMFNSGLAIQE